MKSFRKRYDLNDYTVVGNLLKKAESCHRAIQNVEAGLDYNKQDMATATFLFLDLLGYYPETFLVDWGVRKVEYIQMVHADTDTYLVFGLEGSRTTPKMSLFGTEHVDFSVVKLDQDAINTVVDKAFPKAQLNGGTDVTMDDKKPHLTHLTIREKYMQGNGSLAPVASGSATCSDLIIALMQATTRMIHAILTTAKLDIVQKRENERQVLKKSRLADMYRGRNLLDTARAAYFEGRTKYNKGSWVPGGTLTGVNDRFKGHSISHVWFDELLKMAEPKSDEKDLWAKWSSWHLEPVAPKPDKPKFDRSKAIQDALTKTREEFYAAEGKTPANILTWVRTEAYLRKVFNLTK